MAWVSGIDWSGDPGDPGKPGASPLLVVAMASTTTERLPIVTENLASIRKALHWSETTPFHFIDSDKRSRASFFKDLDIDDLVVHVLIETKSGWFGARPPGGRNRPNLMLDQTIANLISRVPMSMTAGQTILVDRPKSETAAIRGTEAVIRATFRARGIGPLPKIKPMPDHHADAQLIQVADMFAGAVVAWGPDGGQLKRFGARLVIL